MKRAIALITLFLGFTAIQSFAQCKKTHYFCTSQLTKEEQSVFYDLDNQSKSATFAKGEDYELSFICYKGFDYRLSVCTDIVDGTGEKVTFELFVDEIVKGKDGKIERQRVSIYNNANDNNKAYVKFATDKTKKYYLTVNVPATGKSKNKKLNQTNQIIKAIILS